MSEWYARDISKKVKTGSKTYCSENYDEDDLITLAEELGDEIVPIAGDGGGGMRRFPT